MGEETKVGETTEKAKKKSINPNIVIPPKKPKLSKTERRALQEAQRAAKQQQQQQQKGNKGNNKPTKQQSKQQSKQPETKEETSIVVQPSEKKSQGDGNKRTANLFSHLPPYKGMFSSMTVHASVRPSVNNN